MKRLTRAPLARSGAERLEKRLAEGPGYCQGYVSILSSEVAHVSFRLMTMDHGTLLGNGLMDCRNGPDGPGISAIETGQ